VAAKVAGPTDEHERLTGLAFCFLPLPAKTGLGVHVNGYFELSTNRRDIWTGEDMSGDGRLRAEWNVALLQDVVAPCYLRLLERMKANMGFSLGYQHLWPTGNLVSPWDKVRDSVMQVRFPASVVIAVNSRTDLNRALLSNPAQNAAQHELLCTVRCDGELIWVSSKQAVLVPDGAVVADGRLLRILTNENVPVIDAISDLKSLLLDCNAYSSLATPQFVRNQLRTHCNGENGTGCYNAEDTSFLLEYCLQSLPNDRLDELDSLPLLPLQDGSVGRFVIFNGDQRCENALLLSRCRLACACHNS
jgi:sacsin